MSSIYKKGRDGYYYYQTYVYNPESKKKDKRIFHALRTKDLFEAESKQQELDSQYGEQSLNLPSLEKKNYNFSPKATILIICSTIFLTTVVVNYFNSKTNPKKLKDYEKEHEVNVEQESNVIKTPDKQISYLLNPSQLDSMSKKKKVEKMKSEKGSNDIISEISDYTIVRVDKLSDLFEQGKIYVTIDKNSTNEIQQRILCEEIAKSYSEFSNVIICLYANDKAGKYLASGYSDSVSIEDQKQVWLGMYTYNSVEGAYFDNNPTSYLGIY